MILKKKTTEFTIEEDAIEDCVECLIGVRLGLWWGTKKDKSNASSMQHAKETTK